MFRCPCSLSCIRCSWRFHDKSSAFIWGSKSARERAANAGFKNFRGYISSVEDDWSHLQEGIVELALREASFMTVDLGNSHGVVDGNVVWRDADKFTVLFVLLHDSS